MTAFNLNINITGLDKIADAIMALAQSQKSEAKSTKEQGATPAFEPVSTPVPFVPAPMAPAAAPQSVPVPPTIPVQPMTQASQQTPAAQPVAPVEPSAVQTTQQSYALDDLATAAMTLMDSGRMTDLQTLLASFGVDALPALPKSQYGAFATALRGMGARI